ncbi:MAG: TetR/AcrR family transcriptional regulator [Spirochaetia bacterium]|nr:TetR/AcrR family transcriptional regulator [Spirochaetia bacterium]
MKKTAKAAAPDKKEAIFKAAIEEFVEHGFDGARTQSIAKRAGVNKALLHYYFSSKEKMYEQAFETVASFIIERLSEVVEVEADSVEERLSRVMDVYIEVFTEYADYIKLILQDAMRGGRVLKKVIFAKMPRIVKVYGTGVSPFFR